jgi:Spy/CpxP family protein refolding chaperone
MTIAKEISMPRRWIRRWTMAAALFAALLAPDGTAARPPHDPGRFIARHAERLGLSAETLTAIEGVLDASRERNEALEAEADRTRDALRDVLSGPSPDRAQVMAAAAQVDAAMANLHHNRLEAILAIHALLTPAQREELVKIREERGGRGRRGCADDVAAHCADAAPGAAALRCLAERYESLTEGCRATIERLGEEPRRRRFGP